MNPVAATSVSTESMALVAFTGVASVILLLCIVTGPERDDLAEFYTGFGRLGPMRNGLAIAGDYISAATVLGTCGVVALTGYDGAVLALATALSLTLLMFLLAEPLRNAGQFTMGDVLARRMPGRAARLAACLVTLAALLPMMLVQLAGAGDLLGFLLGFDSAGFKTGVIVTVGGLMISYAAIGGMKGTAVIQLLKIVTLLGSGTVVSVLILRRFDWDPGALLAAAVANNGAGSAYLKSGLQFVHSGSPRLDMISAYLTVMLGGAALPHVTMRMYTARHAREVRRSMSWAVTSTGVFALMISVIGFGATALIGSKAIAAADPQGNTAFLLGSRAAFGAELSTAGALVFTTVTTALFLTLLASVSGMILACANSLAHDVFAHWGRTEPTPLQGDDAGPLLGARGRRPHHRARHLLPAPQPAAAGLPRARHRRVRARPGAGVQPVLAPLHPYRAALHADRRHARRDGPDHRHHAGVGATRRRSSPTGTSPGSRSRRRVWSRSRWASSSAGWARCSPRRARHRPSGSSTRRWRAGSWRGRR